MTVQTIFLTDDHSIVREGVRLLLECEPDMRIVGEANSGLGVVDQVERLRPDVLVTDLEMMGLDGLELTRQVTARLPATRVVILSMHADEATVLRALGYGAMAYVVKDAGGAHLISAIRTVGEGRRYLSPPLDERAVDFYATQAAQMPAEPYDQLTAREREIFQLAAEGYSNPKIAIRLSISPRTVDVHRTNLMRKLGLHSQSDLVRYALKRGPFAADR